MEVCKQAPAETPIGTAVSAATCGGTNRTGVSEPTLSS